MTSESKNEGRSWDNLKEWERMLVSEEYCKDNIDFYCRKIRTINLRKLILFAHMICYGKDYDDKVKKKPRQKTWWAEPKNGYLLALTVDDIDPEVLTMVNIKKRQAQDYLQALRSLSWILRG